MAPSPGDMLAQLAANHLAIGQYEPARAALLDLHRLLPAVSLRILLHVVRHGGHLPGFLCSASVPSPAHLAWLCLGDYLAMEGDPALVDVEVVEFELYKTMLESSIKEIAERLDGTEGYGHGHGRELPSLNAGGEGDVVGKKKSGEEEGEGEGREEGERAGESTGHCFQQMLTFLRDARAWGLEPYESEEAKVPAKLEELSESMAEVFELVVAEQAELLDATCQNVAKQIEKRQYKRNLESQKAVNSEGEAEERRGSDARFKAQTEEKNESQEGPGILPALIQQAHVKAIVKLASSGSFSQACIRLRFLREEFLNASGDGYSECSGMFQSMLAAVYSRGVQDSEMQARAAEMYEAMMANGSAALMKMLEAAEDERVHEEALHYSSNPEQLAAPPLERLHLTLTQLREAEDQLREDGVELREAAIVKAVREMYHYARVERKHLLSCVLEDALVAVGKKHFQKAADILAPFVKLRPLVAAMGWDLLAGDTDSRSRMMHLLWEVPTLEEEEEEEGGGSETATTQPADGSAKESCIDQLCDQLCYRLRLASFVASTHRAARETQRMRLVDSESRKPVADSSEFVAQLVLERLAIHSPIRVLFDVVPDISAHDAIALISQQPLGMGPGSALRRAWDVELLRMFYAIQSAVRAFGTMEAAAADSAGGAALSGLDMETSKHLAELEDHFSAITTPSRKLWMIGFVVDVLHIDATTWSNSGPSNSKEFSRSMPPSSPQGLSPYDSPLSHFETATPPEDSGPAVEFISAILTLLRTHMPPLGEEIEGAMMGHGSNSSPFNMGGGSVWGELTGLEPERVGKPAWKEKAQKLWKFLDEWDWRLAALQRMASAGPVRVWQWHEALAVLRAAPSTLLNMCVQRAEYALGEEAVHRFALPPEEAASLQLAEWVDGAVAQASMDGTISRVAKGEESLDFAALHARLSPFASVMLCLDVATASARSALTASRLLEQAQSLIPQCEVGGQPQSTQANRDPRQESAMVGIAKKLLQRLQEIQAQDRSKPLHALLTDFDPSAAGSEISRAAPTPRAIMQLQQTIEECYEGKRHFLSAKLHNLVKALASPEENPSEPHLAAAMHALKGGETRFASHLRFSLGPNIGLQPFLPSPTSPPTPVSSTSSREVSSWTPPSSRGVSKPTSPTGLSSPYPSSPLSQIVPGVAIVKAKGYLPAFIHYVATIGEIVDDIETTHMFNFFSLIYERPNDLLTRLVFERGSADAASKVASIMGADLVHQVITACVPPVYPPKNSRGWARIQRPTMASPSEKRLPGGGGGGGGVGGGGGGGSSNSSGGRNLYPLQLDVVKHLHETSPVRAILACIFGSSRFTSPQGDSTSVGQQKEDGHEAMARVQAADADRKFHDFALEHSLAYPALHRWIQLQTNIRKVADSPAASRRSSADGTMPPGKRPQRVKRLRPLDGESNVSVETDHTRHRHQSESGRPFWGEGRGGSEGGGEGVGRNAESLDSLLSDWESQGPYIEAMESFIEEGKLGEALSLADKWLPDGAPDKLLQLLMEEREGYGGARKKRERETVGEYKRGSRTTDSWQFCIRLRDKEVASKLALKYFHSWDMEPAMDVMQMCLCHVALDDSIKKQVQEAKELLARCGRVLEADSQLHTWQEVEEFCLSDAEGLALRLAERGAVSAAVEVAQAYSLRPELRQELQGRYLALLMVGEVTKGGGAAVGLRYVEDLSGEDALPVTMAAMEQIESLHLKQILVRFLLRRRRADLNREEEERLKQLSLGLQMLRPLPRLWQQRCAAVHEQPSLILETLLMWKQLHSAQQLLHEFPVLRDDDLIMTYAAKALASDPYRLDTYRLDTYRLDSFRLDESRRSSGPQISTSPKALTGRLPNPISTSLSRLQKEASRVFPWNKGSQRESPQMRGVGGEALPQGGTAEEEGQPFSAGRSSASAFTMGEWILTGDSVKDEGVRAAHRYENVPSAALFKELMGLCSDETSAACGALTICSDQIRQNLSSDKVCDESSPWALERALHAARAYVEALSHVRGVALKMTNGTDTPRSGRGPQEDDEQVRSESIRSAEEEQEGERERDSASFITTGAHIPSNRGVIYESQEGRGSGRGGNAEQFYSAGTSPNPNAYLGGNMGPSSSVGPSPAASYGNLLLVGQTQGAEGGGREAGREAGREGGREMGKGGGSPSEGGSAGGAEVMAELLGEVEAWLARVELLQSLFSKNVRAAIEDVVEEGGAGRLRDRLIAEERYELAEEVCEKCKVDAVPLWIAWGQTLLLLEKYEEARLKFRNAMQLHWGDPTEVIGAIMKTLETTLPVDVGAADTMYKQTARSVLYSYQDALNPESYLDALNYPPAPPRGGGMRRHSLDWGDLIGARGIEGENEVPTSHLEPVRYQECLFYLYKYARHEVLPFLFRHGRYKEACLLFLPADHVPLPPGPTSFPIATPTSSPQRPDALASEYGSLDDLCALCVAYDQVDTLEQAIISRGVLEAALRGSTEPLAQHTLATLQRICTYFEGHRHFHHLYRFQMLAKDHVAGGLTSVQLFLNSAQLEEALRHLDRAKNHFDEGFTARQLAGEQLRNRSTRSKKAAAKLTEDELAKLKNLSALQMEVLSTLGYMAAPPWTVSLFGNPNEPATLKRRCDVAEVLAERNFNLTENIVLQLGLPAAHIYAGVAASFAERHKTQQLLELLRRHIKGTLDDDDWDQVLMVAIKVYALRHRERPDRLIEQLVSSHRKVLAYVACGRLKTAFQIASSNRNEADVIFIYDEAADTNPVKEMCRQWLFQQGVHISSRRKRNV